MKRIPRSYSFFVLTAVLGCAVALTVGFIIFPFSSVRAQPSTAVNAPDATQTQAAAPSGPSSYGIPQESLPGYPAQGISAGVWNQGQAALWDLHLIDHFRYFGPQQRARGHRPEQPINFSHIVHVQGNKMECQYCHWNVAKSPYAAIPDVELCMGCHKMVNSSDPAANAEIEKLKGYWERGEAIPWKKVHVMPDYYRFNHKRHVKGGVTCHECHGQVGEMPVVERVSSMKMGWCIDCHRQRGTTIDCASCHH
jgi:hypothetical protein